MAFVFTVEDGTGVAGANAYVSLAWANDYHAGRGSAEWAAATDDAKRAAIVRATDHLETLYGGRFLGVRATRTQSLHWPAHGAWRYGLPILGLPEEIKRACAEYAVRALAGPLAPDQDVGGGVVQETASAGGLSSSVTYARAGAIPQHPVADRLVRPLLVASAAVRF